MPGKIHRDKGLKPLALPRERLKKLWMVERSVRFRFRDRGLLDQALTHPSYAHEEVGKKIGHYEQLEFIGDAVLDLVIGHLLFCEYPEEGEGYLTRARADLVNKNRLAELAALLELGDAMRLGRGERRTSGWLKASILAAAFEALVGAMYMDGGYVRTFRVVERLFRPLIKDREVGLRDPRSQLQEWTQKHYHTIPGYQVLESVGPGHKRTFRVAITLAGERLAVAEGPSKKEASRRAALEALKSVPRQPTVDS